MIVGDLLAPRSGIERRTPARSELRRRPPDVSLVVYQVVGCFDVAARLCAGDGPIAALVGGSSVV